MNNKPLLGLTASRRLEEKDIHLTLKKKKNFILFQGKAPCQLLFINQCCVAA